VLLISGSFERAHYAFIVATAAAAIGREVVLFATNHGAHALARDWHGLADGDEDARVQARGVAGLDLLRAAAAELSVRLIACESGLRVADLPPEALLPGVEVAGIVTFLDAVGAGPIVTL
jgi:peroxiredoxin family protein